MIKNIVPLRKLPFQNAHTSVNGERGCQGRLTQVSPLSSQDVPLRIIWVAVVLLFINVINVLNHLKVLVFHNANITHIKLCVICITYNLI